MSPCDQEESDFVQLPLHVVLSNNVASAYFTDYLSAVGGQNLIDCYMAIEVGFFLLFLIQFLFLIKSV